MLKNHFRTVIVGAGFGGLNAAIKLGQKEEEVLIIDRSNHHLFQPLLYQVATAGLSPADIATPIREILKKYSSISVIMDEVTSIDKNKCELKTTSKLVISFDHLIIAVGARHSYFGNDEWENIATGLKSLDDALCIREKMLNSFELSEIATENKEIEALTTFVVIGAGPTGVEMAGAIAEIAAKTLSENFRHIDTKKSRIFLIEGSGRILNTFHKSLSLHAKKDLEKLGVIVKLNTFVTGVTEDGVSFGDEFISSKNIIWAAGNKASPLLQMLDSKLDSMGRVIVNHDCSILGNSNIFVIGDASAFNYKDKYLPGLAPVAAQQGKYVAKIIYEKATESKRESFKYIDKGSMATIGKSKAILEVGSIRITGFIAWVAWSFVHILFLVLFRNKVSILMSWIYNYLTEQRGARLIKGKKGRFS